MKTALRMFAHTADSTRSKVVAAASFFGAQDRLSRLCLTTALSCSLSLALVTSYLFTRSKPESTVVVLDPAGNSWLATGRRFDHAPDFHVQQALLAANTLLLRNPAGFDLPEMMQTSFAADAQNKAQALRKSEAQEFQSKQLQQKPLISHIDALSVRPDSVQMRAKGQLLRIGAFQGQALNEIVPFTLQLTLQHNPDLIRNRLQPTIVTDFEIHYEELH